MGKHGLDVVAVVMVALGFALVWAPLGLIVGGVLVVWLNAAMNE